MYRVKIWRRHTDELEPAEDYLAERTLSVGDVVDLWHDSRPRNFRICSVRDGEIIVGEDAISVLGEEESAAPGVSSVALDPTAPGRRRRGRVVDLRGALYRMSDLAFLRYLRDGVSRPVCVADYGRHVGDIDFRATGTVADFAVRLAEIEREREREPTGDDRRTAGTRATP